MLEKLGVTQADIDRRPVVATGYCEEELLPPYLANTGHKIRAEAIRRRVMSARLSVLLPSRNDIAQIGTLETLKTYPVVEVVGSFSIACVPEAVDVLTTNGYSVYIDARNLWSSYPDLPDKVLMNDVVTRAKASEATIIDPNISLFRKRR